MICPIYKVEVQTDMNSHIKSHGFHPKDFYYRHLYPEHKCLNCGTPIEYRHSLNRTLRSQFCNKSCQVSYRNKQNCLNNTNPFQKCNLTYVNGKSVTHIKLHQSSLRSGRFSWMNNGTEECKRKLSEMHRMTALHQIENGNSIYSAQYHSSKEELYFWYQIR